MKQWINIVRQDSWVRPLFAAYKKQLIGSVLLGFLAFVFASALMFTSGYLVSASAVVVSILMLHIPLIFVRIFGIGRPILNYFERLTSHDWVFRVTTLLRTKLYHTLEPVGIFYSSSQRLGDTLSLFAEDIAHIQDLFLRTVFPLIIAWLLYLGGALVLGFFSCELMAFWLLVLALVLIGIPLASIALYEPRQQAIKAYNQTLYEEVSENIFGVNDWLYAGRTEECISHIQDIADKRNALKHWLATFDHVRDFLLQLCFLAIIGALIVWSANYFGAQGQQNPDAYNWIAAFALAFFPLIDAFAAIPRAATTGMEKLSSIERVNDLQTISQTAQAEKFSLGNFNSEASNTIHPHKPYDLILKNVSFSYANAKAPLLENISLHIPQGENLMILGPSGTGKTTLSLLMRGDLIPDRGQITLAGLPVHALGDSISKHLCVVSQDPHIFNLTIAENIRLACEDASDEDLFAALEVVGLTSFVEALPQGLNTPVGEAGFYLSGGQRHRLALARAILSDAPILLLDEPASALDPETEKTMLSLLLSAWSDKTIILITHHLTMAPAFDQILMLTNSRIEFLDTFDHLMSTNSHFRALYDCENLNTKH